jgi:capsular polysaccharide biosynthesis protein
MELRTYWHILIRRWWLALIPAIIVLSLGLVTYRQPVPVYQVGIRFTVGYTPEASTTSLYDKYYSAWLASEYIASGLGEWAKTGDFAAEVSRELQKQNMDIPAAALAGRVATDVKRSMITLYIQGSDARQLEAIATAAIAVMQTRNAQAFPQLGPNGAIVRAVDPPVAGQVPLGLRAQLDLPIRMALALGVGIALVFFAHYISPAKGRA